MATRFYLGPRGTGTIPVPKDASWEGGTLSSPLRGFLETTTGSTARADVAGNASLGTNPSDTISFQYCSAVLAAQTITGTVKGIIRCSEAANTANFMPQLLLKVVSGDGLTERGVLLAHITSAITSELATALTARKFPRGWAGAGATLTSQTAQAGDRIVVEFGVRQESTATTQPTFGLGNNAGTDLAENETDTTLSNSWIEFSQNLFPSAVTPQPPILINQAVQRAANW